MAELLLDFLGRETERKPTIIGRGILPVKGKAILAGAPKSNKSFVVLNAALDIAKGRHLFGAKYKDGTPVFPVVKSQRVLLFEQEVGEDGLRNRLRGILPDAADWICDFSIVSKDVQLKLDNPAGLAAIERHIEDSQAQVVILDPLSKFHNSDENSSQEMGKVMGAGDYLIQKYGVSLLYVHHTGLAVYDKESTRRGGARMRGSSAIFADVDTFVEVVRTGAAHVPEPVLSLNFELRQGEPILPQWIKRTRSGKIEYIQENSLGTNG